ncbi:hypothetical protein GWI33_019813 [Rhynchophorus ferrugineus]|uniref:Uncharacterized protein n=1 Tax=Rhynchophorus ferrugineus TaxID=354439 RepID=A0A834HSV8_RHYFE|nr:hypothetical protein GWI33_019813 [Rhynchophorus ferrugineus]
MGLFGGFKAKFTKDSSRKVPKSVKGAEVVCLGYRVRSEFDDLPRNTTATIKSPNIMPHKTEIIDHDKGASTSSVTSREKTPKKKVSPVPKIPIKESEKPVENVNHNIIPNRYPSEARIIDTKIPSNPKSPIKESERSANHDIIIHRSLPETSNIERNPNSIYVTGKTSSFEPKPKKEIKSILKGAAPPPPPPPPLLTTDEVSDHHRYDNNIIELSKDHDEHQSNFIFTTHSKSKDYTRTTAGAISSSRLLVDSDHTADIQTFIHAEVTEHNVSSDNSINHVSFGRAISHTSRQATSIFFDGDDEPEIQQRPRRVQINSDDDRRSSADC